MAAVAAMIRARGGAVDERFAVAVSRGKAAKEAPLDQARLKPAPPRGDWPFLTHYTREPDGAWPGESPAAYANWLAFGPREARRDAVDALRRILAMREIVASGRLMPASTPMVSFTARPPWELGEIIRWRRGLRRWTVRPYGLAIRREALERLGAQAVAYTTKAALAKLPPEERLFAQSDEWAREAEWRVRGACLFSGLPHEALRVIAPSAEEARILEREFGVEGHAVLE
ncbi:MAG: hypothetical protein HY291_02480 [Planctomycetes bacterium]|nr:hypothetical protein [Planctomycetota bacterium]